VETLNVRLFFKLAPLLTVLEKYLFQACRPLLWFLMPFRPPSYSTYGLIAPYAEAFVYTFLIFFIDFTQFFMRMV